MPPSSPTLMTAFSRFDEASINKDEASINTDDEGSIPFLEEHKPAHRAYFDSSVMSELISKTKRRQRKLDSEIK